MAYFSVLSARVQLNSAAVLVTPPGLNAAWMLIEHAKTVTQAVNAARVECKNVAFMSYFPRLCVSYLLPYPPSVVTCVSPGLSMLCFAC